MSSEQQSFIIITGNPVDGFEHTGPFASHEEAVEAAENSGGDWWIAPLHAPK